MKQWKQPWLAAVGLAVAVFLVYWPGLSGGMVFDDFPNIVNNTALHTSWDSGWRAWVSAIVSSPASELQRPLSMLTFAVNHAMTGLDPHWMKLTNVTIHALNSLIVYGLSNRLLETFEPDCDRNNIIALWVAAAWALNPINLTAVLYVVQRMESLAHTFVFAGIWLYLIGRARLMVGNRGWIPLLSGLVGCTLIGATAKESAVLLPIYALAIEGVLFNSLARSPLHERRMLATFGLLLVIPGLLGIAWIIPRIGEAAYAGRSFDAIERILTEARILAQYIHWTIAPDLRAMSLYHDYIEPSQGLFSPPSTAASIFFLLCLVALSLVLRKSRPIASLGIVWFLSAHLLTGTVIPLELMFEHRNYFASLGLCLTVADFCLRVTPSASAPRIGMSIAGALLILYLGTTAARVHEWSNPFRHSLTEAHRHPESPRATYDLARNYVILSEYRAESPILADAFRALEIAMNTPGASPLPESTALMLAARTHRTFNPQWWSGMQRKLQEHSIGPQEIVAINQLVQCQINRLCSFPESNVEALFKAAQREPPSAELLSAQGNYALNILGEPSSALSLWLEAAQRAPTVAQYRISIAKLLIAMNRSKEAQSHIEALRHLGKFGQYEAEARELESLAAAESTPR